MCVKRRTSRHLQCPVIEDALRERLATSCLTESGVETKGLRDGKMGLDREHGRADTLFFAEDLTTTLVET